MVPHRPPPLSFRPALRLACERPIQPVPAEGELVATIRLVDAEFIGGGGAVVTLGGDREELVEGFFGGCCCDFVDAENGANIDVVAGW